MAATTAIPHSLFFVLLLFLFLLSSPIAGKFTPPSSSPRSHLRRDSSSDQQQPFVGFNIGTDFSTLLSPSDIAAFLVSQHITHVRFYDADPVLLSALSSDAPGLSVIVGVPNSQLLALGSSNASASAWVARHILPFHSNAAGDGLRISAVAVGDEVPTVVPSSLPLLLPAIQSIYAALAAANLSGIPVSTPLPFSVVLDRFPPSQAFFNKTLADAVILPLLRFLNATGAPLMLNLYPYYALMQSRVVVPLDNALFKPLPPSMEEVDPNSLLHYTNVFDAMIDAAYYSMRNLNFSGVPVLVTESGWPSGGSRREEPYATRDYASTYNSNLIKHVLDRQGTPLHPEFTPSVYIYELFNEDLRLGPQTEAHWGLFYGNGKPVYLLQVTGAGGLLANDTTNRTYCVAAEGTERKELQAALDWACGPGRADCSEIQPGERCYEPNDVKNHASYAFDSYYKMEGKVAGSCYFKGVAMITTTDPSHGKCSFPESKPVNINAKSNANRTEISGVEKSIERLQILEVFNSILCMIVVIIYTSA